MRLIHPGDVVLVSRNGRLFHARVRGRDAAGGYAIAPIERGVTYRHAAAREVVDHWAHTPDAGFDRPAPGQLPLDAVLDEKL
ncbi:MAG TPA: hypothetical protein VHW26_05335 [Solirubrobacteraceae bacterium]|jgi:hypothetical protein|nr:hypothetical protein [Solirubrobacteraceae bacterium]